MEYSQKARYSANFMQLLARVPVLTPSGAGGGKEWQVLGFRGGHTVEFA
jgi:hypothetical protein